MGVCVYVCVRMSVCIYTVHLDVRGCFYSREEAQILATSGVRYTCIPLAVRCLPKIDRWRILRGRKRAENQVEANAQGMRVT